MNCCAISNLAYDAKVSAPILLQTSFNFKRQINYPETILIETYIVKIERKKVFLEHLVKSAITPNLLYGIGDALVMWYDFTRNVTVNPPEELHNL